MMLLASRRSLVLAQPRSRCLPKAARLPRPSTRLAQPRRVVVSVQASAQPSTASNTVDVVKQELRCLEVERDEAIQTAEHASRTVVKLEEMVTLLEKLALERVKSGNEEGARSALVEKASAKEAMAKTSEKAQLNFALAARLAQKIGDKQHQLIDLLRTAGTGPAAATTAPPSNPPPSSGAYRGSASGAYGSSASGYSSAGSSSSYSSSPFGSDAYMPGVPKWQQSLEEAKERIKSVEQAAASTAAYASNSALQKAEDSIAAARDRLRNREREGILEAKQRLRMGAEESIAEARDRLRRQDAEVLEYVQKVMARYRRGEYVSDEDIEFAFQQLEKRFLL